MPLRRSSPLHGPPLALPAPLDRAADAWWATGPRTRAALGALAGLLLLVAGVAVVAAAMPGTPVQVHVATRTLEPGDALDRGALRQQAWPAQLVPPQALTGRDAPTGTVRALVPSGSPLTSEHLGDDGPAAGLVAGDVAVAVPVESLPALRPGDHVVLVGPDGHGGGRPLTDAGRVLADDGHSVWIGVPAADAVAVSAAVAAGTIAVAVRAP
ncbi:MAG: hypothetical protein JJT89_13660 [Nitriliruptoraceae bacterium]|nr:hypothetical protein [Nitriliruptoraceae bacterium]